MSDDELYPDMVHVFMQSVHDAVAEVPGASFDGRVIIVPEDPIRKWHTSDRLNRKELEEGILLEHRASSAPWKANRDSGDDWLIGSFGDDDDGQVYLTTDHVHASAMNGAGPWDDATFIAWSRNNIGRLLRELERLYALEMGQGDG